MRFVWVLCCFCLVDSGLFDWYFGLYLVRLFDCFDWWMGAGFVMICFSECLWVVSFDELVSLV